MVRPENIEPQIGALDFYIQCFWELHTTRINGGALSFSSIYEFARILDIKPFHEFRAIMRRLDHVYLDFIEKKKSKNA